MAVGDQLSVHFANAGGVVLFVLVFPAASRPSINKRISFDPKILSSIFETDPPMMTVFLSLPVLGGVYAVLAVGRAGADGAIELPGGGTRGVASRRIAL
jgi:hypothetical protein